MTHYGTLAGADTYNATRGRAEWADAPDQERAAALIRGSDYVDQRYRGQAGACDGPRFPGRKAGGRAQEREWPRSGATDRDGNIILINEVPREVEQATYEAAYRELLQPGSLSPDYVPSEQVSREKVGPIEVSYATSTDGDGVPNRPVVTVIDEILGPVLARRPCGTAVLVV